MPATARCPAAAGAAPTGPPTATSDDSTCLELALEGERLCKGGECRLGVQFLEAAVQVGTDDLKILSAVYSQLGNAHFYLQDYAKALDYHTLDLSLARTMGDRAGEAKASGNLGNTLKVLGKFEEASLCCLRHLDLARELADRMGEARALYNLGNVHHAHGKHTGRVSQGGSSSSLSQGAGDPGATAARDSLRRAAEYYEQNLAIVRDLGDRASVGRACGNLGNTHYLLGNFHEAIRYHTERLALAREFGDRGAERRAHSNLGNAHILLGELDTAADHYRRCLGLARQLGEPALEAQACYSLGNTCALMRDYRQAIDYHARHMRIAEQLGDRVGEARACWSLGNAHAAVGEHARALEFAARHLALSEHLRDDVGAAAARLNLADLRHLLGLAHPAAEDGAAAAGVGDVPDDDDDDGLETRPDGGGGIGVAGAGELEGPNLPRVSSESSGLDVAAFNAAAAAAPQAVGEELEAFWDLVSRYQSRRMDEQRCPVAAAPAVATVPRILPAAPLAAAAATAAQEDAFLDMLAGLQGSRMNDQRASLPSYPGFRPQRPPPPAGASAAAALGNKENLLPDDAFFDMLMRCQATRLDEQRTALPPAAPTVPEDDVFDQIAGRHARSGRSGRQQLLPPPPPSRADDSSVAQQPGPTSAAGRLLSKLSLKKRKR